MAVTRNDTVRPSVGGAYKKHVVGRVGFYNWSIGQVCGNKHRTCPYVFYVFFCHPWRYVVAVCYAFVPQHPLHFLQHVLRSDQDMIFKFTH